MWHNINLINWSWVHFSHLIQLIPDSFWLSFCEQWFFSFHSETEVPSIEMLLTFRTYGKLPPKMPWNMVAWERRFLVICLVNSNKTPIISTTHAPSQTFQVISSKTKTYFPNKTLLPCNLPWTILKPHFLQQSSVSLGQESTHVEWCTSLII